MSRQCDNLEKVLLQWARFSPRVSWLDSMFPRVLYVSLHLTALCGQWIIPINLDHYDWNLSSSLKIFENVILEYKTSADLYRYIHSCVRQKCMAGNPGKGSRFRIKGLSRSSSEQAPATMKEPHLPVSWLLGGRGTADVNWGHPSTCNFLCLFTESKETQGGRVGIQAGCQRR